MPLTKLEYGNGVKIGHALFTVLRKVRGALGRLFFVDMLPYFTSTGESN